MIWGVTVFTSESNGVVSKKSQAGTKWLQTEQQTILMTRLGKCVVNTEISLELKVRTTE